MTEKPLWYKKHRPTTLDEYVWRDPSLRKLVEKWIGERSPPHLALVGPSGTGKTSLINLIIAGLGVSEEDVLRLPASIANNVETMRTTVLGFCQSGGWSGLKIVFFDEADNLTHAAQEALRNLMDDYNNEVRFFFTGNAEHRMSDPVLLRGTIVHIDALDQVTFMERLCEILVKEGIEITDDTIAAVEKITTKYYPSMRAAINLMQDCVFEGKLYDPTDAAVRGVHEWEQPVLQALSEAGMGLGELRNIIDAIRKEDLENLFPFCYERSETFGKKEGKAIMVIRDAMIAHGSCGFPHINILDMLIKLMLLQAENEAGK